jgi:hypothetical protein
MRGRRSGTRNRRRGSRQLSAVGGRNDTFISARENRRAARAYRRGRDLPRRRPQHDARPRLGEGGRPNRSLAESAPLMRFGPGSIRSALRSARSIRLSSASSPSARANGRGLGTPSDVSDAPLSRQVKSPTALPAPASVRTALPAPGHPVAPLLRGGNAWRLSGKERAPAGVLLRAPPDAGLSSPTSPRAGEAERRMFSTSRPAGVRTFSWSDARDRGRPGRAAPSRLPGSAGTLPAPATAPASRSRSVSSGC